VKNCSVPVPSPLSLYLPYFFFLFSAGCVLCVIASNARLRHLAYFCAWRRQTAHCCRTAYWRCLAVLSAVPCTFSSACLLRLSLIWRLLSIAQTKGRAMLACRLLIAFGLSALRVLIGCTFSSRRCICLRCGTCRWRAFALLPFT